MVFLQFLTCEIGFLTPPIGINLFVAARITKDSIEKISIGVLPLLVPYILMVLILVYFSDWVTYLARFSLWSPVNEKYSFSGIL